jgi:hypothetical protein
MGRISKLHRSFPQNCSRSVIPWDVLVEILGDQAPVYLKRRAAVSRIGVTLHLSSLVLTSTKDALGFFWGYSRRIPIKSD